jgi:RNA polymerase sigma-70 factor (ECF subfamily)
MSSAESALVGGLGGPARPFAAPTTDVKSDSSAPGCLREAVRQYARYVIGLLGRLGVAAADVEDVAQEVYLAIHAQLGSAEARTSFKTWLCGVCRHKAADYRRKRARREQLANARPAEPAQETESPQGLLLKQEAKEVLRRALARLPDEQLEVFVLHAIEDLSMKDVASLVGCPVDTAYTRYRVALQRVKALCLRHKRSSGEP